MMETIDYFLEPAIPFGMLIWLFWYICRDDIREAFSDDEGDE